MSGMPLQTGSIVTDLERWMSLYIDRLQFREFSKNTIYLYERIANEFIEFMRPLDEQIKMEDINAKTFESFLIHLSKRADTSKTKTSSLSKSTKASYLKALRTFFSFISDNNDELFNYMRYFDSIKIQNTATTEDDLNYLNDKDIELLERELSRIKRSGEYNAYRNSMIVKLMLYGGLRISEALQVSLESFSIDEEDLFTIRITGKGNKKQKTYIAVKKIHEEYEFFKKKCSPREDIMKTVSGKRWERTSVYRTINNLYRRAGVQKKGLHILRHSLAMQLTKDGINPIIIQKILRHKTLATTSVYAKATTESIAKALR